ncbi:MAG: GNAT family N-acetyltransferase [Alphaproteobacteria bacterium]|nr:GNAT family N-acetyltransferase [Alphaproteobacteria bacterium]
MDIKIRSAAIDDLPALAALHVRAWQQAYVGQLEQSYLDSLDVTKRLEDWRQKFSGMKGGILLACAPDGSLAGFLAYNPPREPVPEGCDIEIGALYTLQPYWSQGVGYRLYAAAQEIFKAQGRVQSCLKVLDSNSRAIAAYKRWGGIVRPGHADLQIGGKNVQELCVVFRVL